MGVKKEIWMLKLELFLPKVSYFQNITKDVHPETYLSVRIYLRVNTTLGF